MSTLISELQPVRARNVKVTAGNLIVGLSDGRAISVPLDWYPRLKQSTPKERKHWRLIAKGEGIHWPELDEDISVEGIMLGRRPGESPSSLKRWQAERRKKVSSNKTMAVKPSQAQRKKANGNHRLVKKRLT